MRTEIVATSPISFPRSGSSPNSFSKDAASPDATATQNTTSNTIGIAVTNTVATHVTMYSITRGKGDSLGPGGSFCGNGGCPDSTGGGRGA